MSGVVSSQKNSGMPAHVLGIFGEVQQNAVTRLSSLMNGCSMAPAKYFVLGKEICLLSNVLQEREHSFSPSATHGIPTPQRIA